MQASSRMAAGKPGWLLENEHLLANSMIFVDLSVSTNLGVSIGKLGFEFLLLNFCFFMCHLILGRGRSSGFAMSTAPMARNMENPRF